MLTTFAEMGISQLAVKEYGVTRDDLEMIVLIAAEQREFEKEQEEAKREKADG